MFLSVSVAGLSLSVAPARGDTSAYIPRRGTCVPDTHVVERGVRFIPHLTGCCFARSRVARTLSAIGWYSGLVESDGSAVRGRRSRSSTRLSSPAETIRHRLALWVEPTLASGTAGALSQLELPVLLVAGTADARVC